MSSIVATISIAEQIGMDVWNQRYISRVFSTARNIQDIINWAENEGVKNPQISNIQFSEYTGKSI